MFLRNKNIVFIAPNFFHYYKEIKKELEFLGALVYDYPLIRLNLLFRITSNLSNYLYNIYIDRYYSKILLSINNKDIDYLFLISGKFTPEWFLLEFKRQNPCCILILYQWDSLDNNPKAKLLLKYFQRILSFDPFDCQNNKKIQYLPLFCTSHFFNIPQKKIVYDLLFVGNPLSSRYKVIKKVEEICNKNNITFYYYLYLPFVQYLKEVLIRKNTMKIRDIHFRKMSILKLVDLYAKSENILDIHDHKQTGFTMRSIETLGSGKHLITTNKYIYDNYGEGITILNLCNIENLVTLVKGKKNFTQQPNVLTTAQWLLKIFTINNHV